MKINEILKSPIDNKNIKDQNSSDGEYVEDIIDPPVSPPSSLILVFHGTDIKNMKRIKKFGLIPKINRYAIQPDSYGVGGIETWSKEELKDITVVSTTTEFEEAKNYAIWGGSTGDGSGHGVVFGFSPIPTDKVKNIGYTGSRTEWSFYNKIDPSRLIVIWKSE